MSWGQVAMFVVSLVVTYITSKQGGDIEPQEVTESSANGERERGIKINTRSSQQHIPIIYGTRRVGGNDVYGHTCGNDNKHLYLVQTLSEGECDSIVEKSSARQIWFGDKLWNTFGITEGANVSCWFHSGASNQTVDTYLNSADSSWTDALENTCYVVFRLKYDRDYFRGVPIRQIELKGKKVYDFRTSTTAWSDNPVLCLYDYMTNTRYGVGFASNKLDIDSWTTVANYCDTKDFTLNMVISQDRSSWGNVEEILEHFRGRIGYWDGKFYLKVSDLNEEASVMTIEDKHVLQGSDGAASIRISQPGRFNKPDGLKVKFVDKDKSYVVDDIPVGEQTGIIKTLSLLGCTDREMACNLAVSHLERLQLDRSISGTFRDDCIKLEPHDIITLNSDAIGIEDQLMRVVDTNIRGDGLIDLSLQYESYTLYDDDYNLNPENIYTCSLPDPNTEPDGVANGVLEEETYWYRLTSYSKLKVDFDEPPDYAWYDHVEVWMANTVSGLDADFKHQFDTTTSFEIDPVEESQLYWIKLRSVNTWGVKQTLANAVKLYTSIEGKSNTTPESLTYLSVIVNDNTINFYSGKLDDPDIEVYEFRLGGTWSSGVFLAAVRSPNYCITGVKPGVFDFSANTKGTNTLYGVTPQVASAIIFEPKGWTLYDDTTNTDDFSTISGTNVERTLYSGDYYLKCSHTDGVLTGTYYSPEFDLGVGNEDVYYTYIESSTIVTGAGTTWGSVTSSGTDTWEDIDATNKTWNELFETSGAARLDIELYHKKVVTDDWSIAKKMEICSTVVDARYFQIKITITDPLPGVTALLEEIIICLYN